MAFDCSTSAVPWAIERVQFGQRLKESFSICVFKSACTQFSGFLQSSVRCLPLEQSFLFAVVNVGECCSAEYFFIIPVGTLDGPVVAVGRVQLVEEIYDVPLEWHL